MYLWDIVGVLQQDSYVVFGREKCCTLLSTLSVFVFFVFSVLIPHVFTVVKVCLVFSPSLLKVCQLNIVCPCLICGMLRFIKD